jgi:PAS domain S-box-containing protein
MPSELFAGAVPGQVALSRDVLAQAPVPMAITDAESRLIWSNDAVRCLAGRDDVSALTEVIHPDDAAASHAAVAHLIGGGTAWHTWEERWVRADGTIRWVWVHAVRAATGDGSAVIAGDLPAVVRQIIDITDAKTARTELDRVLAELRARNADLERSNEELTTFAYVASHDLSEPLRVISGHVELLSRRYAGRLDEDADRFIGFAVDGCNRMRDLIQDLLRYSRSGRDLRAGPVHLRAVVDTAAGDLAHAVADAGGSVAIDGELPVVTGDAGQLTQVMANLIGNAVKFAAPGRPPVARVSARRRDDGWVVRVTDNGAGVPDEHRERVFGIFQRLQARDVPGTGIGLAICRRSSKGTAARSGWRPGSTAAPRSRSGSRTTEVSHESRRARTDPARGGQPGRRQPHPRGDARGARRQRAARRR